MYFFFFLLTKGRLCRLFVDGKEEFFSGKTACAKTTNDFIHISQPIKSLYLAFNAAGDETLFVDKAGGAVIIV